MDANSKLLLGENSWEGFQGVYIYYTEYETIGYFYKINGLFYRASTLEQEDICEHGYHSGCNLVEPFEIDINGSQILALPTTCGELIYQQIQNIGFVNLLPIEDNIIQMEEPSYKIKVPLPNGKAINGIFQELILTPIDSEIIRKFDAYTWDEENQQQKEIKESEIVNILNSL